VPQADARDIAALAKRKAFVVRTGPAQSHRPRASARRARRHVLIAGKGHETYQIVGQLAVHFDDREEAARVLAALEGTP